MDHKNAKNVALIEAMLPHLTNNIGEGVQVLVNTIMAICAESKLDPDTFSDMMGDAICHYRHTFFREYHQSSK